MNSRKSREKKHKLIRKGHGEEPTVIEFNLSKAVILLIIIGAIIVGIVTKEIVTTIKEAKQTELLANEENECDFGAEVMLLIAQIEIYDQVWSARHMPPKGEHSREAVELVRGFVSLLEEIPDECSEIFPFNVIDELKQEYLE